MEFFDRFCEDVAYLGQLADWFEEQRMEKEAATARYLFEGRAVVVLDDRITNPEWDLFYPPISRTEQEEAWLKVPYSREMPKRHERYWGEVNRLRSGIYHRVSRPKPTELFYWLLHRLHPASEVGQ